MRSMHRYAIIALAVLALALATASNAAAEVSTSGSMTGGLAQNSKDPGTGTSTAQLKIESEAIVNFAAKAGPLSALYRLESNDSSDHTLDNTRNRIDWAVSDALRIRFSGASFGFGPGVAPFGASTVGHFTEAGSPAGHQAGLAQFVFNINNSSVEVNFNTGGMDVGLLLGGQTRMATGSEATTFAPYFSGKFGSITAHAYYVAGSSKDADTGATVDKNELSAAAIYKSGGISGVLQYVTGEPGKDKTWTGINLGVRASGIEFHYINRTQESGSTTTEKRTDIAVAYVASLGEKAEMAIGYADNKEDESKADDSVIMFSVKNSF